MKQSIKFLQDPLSNISAKIHDPKRQCAEQIGPSAQQGYLNASAAGIEAVERC